MMLTVCRRAASATDLPLPRGEFVIGNDVDAADAVGVIGG